MPRTRADFQTRHHHIHTHTHTITQYFATNPTELLDMPPERAVTDPTNPYALRAQLLCAADEGPIGGR